MLKRRVSLTPVFLYWSALIFIWIPSSPAEEIFGYFKKYVRYQEPEFLTFGELKQLSENPDPEGKLGKKLEKIWETPIISNEAYFRGARPRKFKDPSLGPKLVVASWNIEKSFHIDRAIQLFTSDNDFEMIIDRVKAPASSANEQLIKRQRERLRQADVLILQEMDIGNKRSGYVNAAADLAKALDMNYAYGAEQLEIDPVRLGTEKITFEDGSEDTAAEEYYRVDEKKYKGVFGSAVLSRYPIKKVEVFQLKNQAYDWYHKEKEKTTFLENLRRFGSETVFKNEITREMKVGGRIFFRVDLDVPELPNQTLTIINIHLEIKCEPLGRQIQMQEILDRIRGIKNPVIVSGDFNSAPDDLSPTSPKRVAKRALKNPTTWLSLGINALSPHALAVNTTRLVSNVTKNFQDPTTKSIPVIAPNPVKKLFEDIELFRFKDDSAFDFRGDLIRSMNNKAGTLANSNERDFKGFKTTFSVKRPIGDILGKYRLDWMFVKSTYLKEPRDPNGSYQFAPYFGETLEELNTSLLEPISDHHPNVVDLPFGTPSKSTGFNNQ